MLHPIKHMWSSTITTLGHLTHTQASTLLCIHGGISRHTHTLHPSTLYNPALCTPEHARTGLLSHSPCPPLHPLCPPGHLCPHLDCGLRHSCPPHPHSQPVPPQTVSLAPFTSPLAPSTTCTCVHTPDHVGTLTPMPLEPSVFTLPPQHR